MQLVYDGKLVNVRAAVKRYNGEEYFASFNGKPLKIYSGNCQRLKTFLTTFNTGDRVKYRSSKFIVRQSIKSGGWNHLLLKRESDGFLIRGFIDASQCKKIVKIEATL